MACADGGAHQRLDPWPVHRNPRRLEGCCASLQSPQRAAGLSQQRPQSGDERTLCVNITGYLFTQSKFISVFRWWGRGEGISKHGVANE